MIKKPFLILSICLLIPASCWAADAPAPSSSDYLPGQVLVRVEEGVSLPQVQEIAGAVGAKVERRVASWGVYLLSFDPAHPLSEVVERLQAQPGVRYAEPNVKVQVNAIGSDSGTVTAAVASSIIVAVIDTGIDRTHPSLSNLIYTNPDEIAGDGIDNDANGYVDDVHGWDFYEQDNDASGSAGDGAHGTMVAGMVDQGSGGQGISILPLQVGPGPWLDLAAIVEAIDYAVAQGARVINMSFGGGFTRSLADAVQYAVQRGVLVVAAAGNSGWSLRSYPAALPGVISVAASNNAGKKTWWSNYGGTVDFTAPGENVTTTHWGGGTASVSGTSFSSPFVAGVLARILAALPALTPDQAVQKLQGFVKDVYSLNHPFFRGMLGAGLVDNQVARQVAEAFPLDGSGAQPPQQDPGLKPKLESELALARQEVARLQAELSTAEQDLGAAQQAAADAQKSIKQADEKVNQAWKGLIESWQAWYKSFSTGTPTERAAFARKKDQAWDTLYKAMAERRDAQARLRVAQAEEIKARDRRSALAAQLNVAQAKVSELERRLSQLAIPAQSRPRGSTHQSEIEQLLQKLHAVTGSLGRSGLPEGVREMPDLYLSDDSRQGFSSD